MIKTRHICLYSSVFVISSTLALGCTTEVGSDRVAEGASTPEGTVTQGLATWVSRQNNTPCVYSDINGAGSERCFSGSGYSDPLPFAIRSVRPNNSRIWVTDTAGNIVSGTSYFVPDYDTINLPLNSGATRLWIGWQGADYVFVRGNIILEATNGMGMTPYCLDALGGNPYNGLQVGIYPCHPFAAAKWVVTGPPLGGTGYTFSLMDFSNRCLDFASPPATAGAKVQTWDCYWPAPPQQKWFRTNVFGGNGPQAELFYTRTLQGSDFYLDVVNGTITAWQPIQGWWYNASLAQRWVIWDPSPNHPPILH